MKIVSASRRTDIPAFYTPWLLSRLQEGFALTPNPFNPRQITRTGLHPSQVACLVFWTKDPRPLLPHLDDLERGGYRTLFHVTVTGLPSLLEPKVAEPGEITGAIRRLGARLGSRRVIWRFDPILLSPLTPEDRVLETFSQLSRELEGAVERVIISFARPYAQSRNRLRRAAGLEAEIIDLSTLSPGEVLKKIEPLASTLSGIARSRGMEMLACSEKIDLTTCGIGEAACIDGALIEKTFGVSLPPGRDRGQRPECRCSPSVDIGIYGTCRHGCLYCYAGCDRKLAAGQVHHPGSPLLLGVDSAPPLQPSLL